MILSFRNIAKMFSGVLALDNVSFDLKEGEIHGLCGENGAGKSTLMKILSGVYPTGSYEGEIVYQKKPVRFKHVREAERLGIRIIHQELALIPNLSIAENIFLNCAPKGHLGAISWHKLYQQTQILLDQFGFNLSPFVKVGDLGMGQMQLVEISRALSKDARILVLDEPTSALTEKEVHNLFQILRGLKARVTCVYISHRLKEILEITDRVTILRDGKVVLTKETKELTETAIASHMVGQKISEHLPIYKRFGQKKIGKEIFRVENLSYTPPSYSTGKTLRKINFTLREGEILGIAGLMGSGRTELALSLFGEYRKGVSGELYFCGEKTKIANAQDAIHNGLALVTEDRKENGLVLEHCVLSNISMPTLYRFSRYGILDTFQEWKVAKALASQTGIQAPSLQAPCGTLSGGNQQKVVLAKWLGTKPKILILDEPTRGVDIGARYEIYKVIQEFVLEGMAVILISSDLSEILTLSHSILVMVDGQITRELSRNEATEEAIMHFATGTRAA